jgi:hypothetical protein
MKWRYNPAIAFSVFALSWSMSAQTLKIKVLEGKSGKPLANQRVVLMGEPDSGASRQIGDFHTQADGMFTVSLTDQKARSLRVYVEWHHPCAKGSVAFSLKEIDSIGVVSENSCNAKVGGTATPGTLILFVRDETFFEKMAH